MDKQDIIEAYKNATISESSPCPNCGHCPHCGRSNYSWTQMPYPASYPSTPYMPWYDPRFTYTVTCGTSNL